MTNTALALPEDFTMEKAEELYREIMHIYDLADNVRMAIAHEGVTNRDIQLEIGEPFVKKVINSANILTTFYVETVTNKRPITPELQETFEAAFRNIFNSLHELAVNMENKILSKEAV